MEVPDYTIDDFRKDIGPLQWRKPRAKKNMWVFWSGEGEGEREDCPRHPQTDVFSSSCNYLLLYPLPSYSSPFTQLIHFCTPFFLRVLGSSPPYGNFERS